MIQPKDEYKVIESYTIAKYKNDYTLKLDMNENTLGCSPLVTDALKNISLSDISQYPTYGEIEEKIGLTLGVDSNKILITMVEMQVLQLFTQLMFPKKMKFYTLFLHTQCTK